MYISTIFSQTLKSGQTYKQMPTIYQININKFKAGESNKIISKGMFMDVDELEILSEKIIIFNINIEKIKEKYYNNHELTRLERALMLLDISDNDDFRIVFDREKDAEIIYNSIMSAARDEGIEEGIEKGAITKQYEIARNLLSQGISEDVIMRATGLTIKELKELG